MAKSGGSKAASRVPSVDRKSFTVFAAFFHGNELETVGAALVKAIETSPNKNILAVKVKDVLIKGEDITEDGAYVADRIKKTQIEQDIERCKKQFNANWRTLPTFLENDLRNFWKKSSEIEEEKRNSKRNSENEEGRNSKRNSEKEEGRNSKRNSENEEGRNSKRNSEKEEGRNSKRNSEKEEERNSKRNSEKETGRRSTRSAWKEIIPRKIEPADMRLFNEEIAKDSYSVQFVDFFIVIFGKISPRVLVDIKASNIPLQGVFHFIQSAENTLQINHPQLHEDIDFWKKSPHTKGVPIFIETCTVPTDKVIDAQASLDIYDQFIKYLYEIEMIRLQYNFYQNEFLELNDGGSPRKQSVQPKEDDRLHAKVNSDDTAVGVYLDYLCFANESHALKSRRYSCLHIRPFIENNFGRIIVEEANKLIQAAIATEMNMVSYWRVADMIVNALKEVPVRPIEDVPNVVLPPYYELLSWESFAQRFETEKFLYDKNYVINLTEKCKLYVLRRAYYEIVEEKRYLRLSTKLCYRDYCSYIAPNLAPFIRSYRANMEASREVDEPEHDIRTLNEYHYEFIDPELNHPRFWDVIRESRRPKFFGLNFDDTLQQLDVVERTYRFEDNSICCTVENWQYKKKKMTIDMRLCGTTIYVHRWEEFPAEYSRVRILTKNNITCNVSIKDEPSDATVSIQWPNDCQIQFFYDSEACAIEQQYHWTKRQELKRLYTPQGCVINYLMGDTIEVLTPNGVIYMLYPDSYIDPEEIDGTLKYYQPVFGISIVKELEFVRSLHCYGIDCEHFDVTRTDGKKFRVFNGVIMEEKAHYSVYEWTDFMKITCFAERDDGVKMIWSDKDFKVYYPFGDVITTTTIERTVDVDVGCLDKTTENILRKMNPTLIEKVAKISRRQESYVTYKPNYLMQHKHYASIAFKADDEIQITSPDGLTLVLGQKKVALISIDNMLEFRISSSKCSIYSDRGCSDS